MPYDFALIENLCKEIGFPSVVRSIELLKVQLSKDIELCFQNSEKERDCLVGFNGTPWHTHGDFIFSNNEKSIEMDYLDVLIGLKDGTVLVCELWQQNEVKDRWLTHSQYNDEFQYMGQGEEIRVHRPKVPPR